MIFNGFAFAGNFPGKLSLFNDHSITQLFELFRIYNIWNVLILLSKNMSHGKLFLVYLRPFCRCTVQFQQCRKQEVMSSIRLQHYDVTSCKQRHRIVKHHCCKQVSIFYRHRKIGKVSFINEGVIAFSKKVHVFLRHPVYDHFDLYLTPVTLTFNLPEKMFQMTLLLLQDNNCAKLFLKSMHKCTSYGPEKSSIYDHFDLYLTPVTLTFNLPEKMFQMTLLLLQDNNCAKLFLKSMHKCTSYGPEKSSIYDHFDLYLTPATLTFNLPEKMFQIALVLLKDNNCAKLFLISMHKCTSYGPEKSSIYDHFDLYLTPVTLTFNLPEKIFKWHLSSSRTTTVQNYF